LRPPQPPTRVDKRPSVTMRYALTKGVIWRRRMKGASFCHVDRIRPVKRSRPWRTSGSHECIGARPIFRARARRTRVDARGWESWEMFHSPNSQAFVRLAKRMMAAAAA